MVVHTSNHALFGRKGKNLTITVPVTFPEAVLGATIKVPTLADPVPIRVPAGTQLAPNCPAQHTCTWPGRGIGASWVAALR